MGRLAWQRDAGGGFIAWPDGRDAVDHVAALVPYTARTGAWQWSVRCGAARLFGVEDDRQAAADAANAAWPRVVAQAARVAAKAEAEREYLALIEMIAGSDDPDLAPLAAVTDYQSRMWIMQQAVLQPRSPGLEALIAALSADFYQRRRDGG